LTSNGLGDFFANSSGHPGRTTAVKRWMQENDIYFHSFPEFGFDKKSSSIPDIF
jgi:GTP-binding protein EngB required for normal cell division